MDKFIKNEEGLTILMDWVVPVYWQWDSPNSYHQYHAPDKAGVFANFIFFLDTNRKPSGCVPYHAKSACLIRDLKDKTMAVRIKKISFSVGYN